MVLGLVVAPLEKRVYVSGVEPPAPPRRERPGTARKCPRTSQWRALPSAKAVIGGTRGSPTLKPLPAERIHAADFDSPEPEGGREDLAAVRVPGQHVSDRTAV